MSRFSISLILNIIFLVNIIGQRNVPLDQLSANEVEKYAEMYLQEGRFEKASLYYKRLLNENKESPKLNFLIGFCYLNTEYGLDEAITYLKKSVEFIPKNNSEKAPLESHYFLALAYHQNNQFELAHKVLEKLIPTIPAKDQLFIDKAKSLKENCLNAEMISQSVIEISVDNLFELNSKYSDKNPLILNDGKEIIFTSRRENPTARTGIKGKQYDDNIYYSKKEDGSWSVPYSLGNSINTVEHESACWVSKDGKKLIIRRIEKNKSSLFLCERNSNGEWMTPQRFPVPVNSKGNETFGSLSPDGNILFFTSDRKGGYGGTDIYMSESMGNNNWSSPVNLGPKINTDLNEESPFMHENGVLFFCSEGHVSMGGYDVFASFRDEKGDWQAAANMGSPINTINDDFFYQPDPSGKFAYASSERRGSKGQSDIFTFHMNDSVKNGYVMVLGKIHCVKVVEFDKRVEIRINELGNLRYVKVYKVNKLGSFSIDLPAAKKYQITYYYDNQPFYHALLDIPVSYSFLAHDQSIRINTVNLKLSDDLNLINSINENDENETYTSVQKVTEDIKSGVNIASNDDNLNDSILLSELNLNNNNFVSDSNTTAEIFSVRLASSKKRMAISSFAGIDDVKEYRLTDGTYIYYFGEYNYEWEAEIKLRLIRETYPKAIVFVNYFSRKNSN